MLRTGVARPNPRFNMEKKPQNPHEIEIEKKNKDTLTDVTKKLLSDDEGGFENFELAIKEEEMSQKEGKELIEAMLAEQQEEDRVHDIEM